jgi:hypothetical protein
MNKMIAVALSTLFAAGLALAQAPAAKPAEAAKPAAAAPAPAAAPAAKPAEAAKPAAAAPSAPAAKAAAGDCEAKAVSKDGKPLAGAAKTASIKKCEKDAKAK